LSDHTLGIGVSTASVALGATVIEKHFTLSRADGGIDSAFSLEPDEMKLLVEETFNAWQAIGKIYYGATRKEEATIVYRRSIYVVSDVRKGEEFNTKNILVIRPGDGLAPKYYDIILGRRAVCDIKRGTPMDWKYFG